MHMSQQRIFGPAALAAMALAATALSATAAEVRGLFVHFIHLPAHTQHRAGSAGVGVSNLPGRRPGACTTTR